MGNSFKLVDLRICLIPDLNAKVWRVQLGVCVPETKGQHAGVHGAEECVAAGQMWWGPRVCYCKHTEVCIHGC